MKTTDLVLTAKQPQCHNLSSLVCHCRREQCRERQIINHTHTAYSMWSDTFGSALLCAQPPESLTMVFERAKKKKKKKSPQANPWHLLGSLTSELYHRSTLTAYLTPLALVWGGRDVFMVMLGVKSAHVLCLMAIVWAAHPWSPQGWGQGGLGGVGSVSQAF